MEKFEGFEYKECEIAGDPCWLVTPDHIGVKWTEANKHLRSAIIRQSDGLVISSGFRKFVNFHESPDFEPWDTNWPVEAVHKMDGSLLIVSKYKGELICRTRGTTDARKLPNGHEIDGLVEKYKLKEWFDGGSQSSPWSFLFEWTTPTNIIVVREHSEPTLTLIGAINNLTGNYSSQVTLNSIAIQTGIGRPKHYVYNSIAECLADVAAWKGSEGVVLVSPDGETLKKIKAEEYLRLHRLKSSVSSMRALIGAYMESGASHDYSKFHAYIATMIDFETAEDCKESIRKIVDTHQAIEDEKKKIHRFADELLGGMDQKERAIEIVARYKDWRKGYAFLYLKGQSMDEKALTKLLEEKVKES